MRIPEARRPRGFTIIELLTVIAVIGILAAILVPTVSSVRVSADKAKTKVQFSQWAAAIEAFRNEYGYYPIFDSSNLVNPPDQSTDPGAVHVFHDVLAAAYRNGAALPASATGTSPAAQNRKRIMFYRFGESEMTGPDAASPNLIKDAFDNTVIAVLVDRNLDGRIDGADYTSLPAVGGITPTSADIPSNGLRLAVAFYAPAPDATVADPKFIFSWK